MAFKEFRSAIQSQVEKLLRHQDLYFTDLDKDRIYELYLSSFPPGTNNLFIERTEHDCSACKQFIRSFGGVVAIADNLRLISVWDVEGLDSTYAPVAEALSAYVKSFPISNQFKHSERKIGIPSNVVQLKTGEVHEWTHLYAELPARFVLSGGESIGAAISEVRDRKNVFKRSLEELTKDSIEVVLDLISQNSLYRGEEFKRVLQSFLMAHNNFHQLPESQKDLYCWDRAAKLSLTITKIRNSSIGTLLIDISEEIQLDEAVRKFEAVVAPSNYKRPKAVFSTQMLKNAKNKLTKLGLIDSLPRRFAVIEDIKINNVLFANTNVMRQIASSDVFEQMSAEIASVNPRNFDEVEEVSIGKFIAEILPKTTAIELLLENRFAGNLVSIVAPVNADAPSLFKWGNGFSWAYAGNITDSMKQRVKDAGGNVDGVLRFSIQWNENGKNQNDFDAHCLEPNGGYIYFGNKGKKHLSSGMLDVDIIRPKGEEIAVENIIWTDIEKMPNGFYEMSVNTYSDRGGQGGFRSEIEFNGEIYSFDYPHATRSKEQVKIATVKKTKDGFSIKPHLDSSISSKTLWGKTSNQFHPVTSMMLSPNYWDDQQGNGNKHFIFLIDGMINKESPNGFFNEFLRNDLMSHKRVFEALGSKMQVTSQNPKQLSGLGFSSTQRNSVIAKITGHVQRTIKITF